MRCPKAYFPLDEKLSREGEKEFERQSSVISTITGICRAKVNGAKLCRIQYGCRTTKDAFEKGFATLFAVKTIAEKRNEV